MKTIDTFNFRMPPDQLAVVEQHRKIKCRESNAALQPLVELINSSTTTNNMARLTKHLQLQTNQAWPKSS